MRIERGSSAQQPRCEEHQTPACAALEIGQVKILFCRQCLKTLVNEDVHFT